jgi:YihY family inner membrane protein
MTTSQQAMDHNQKRDLKHNVARTAQKTTQNPRLQAIMAFFTKLSNDWVMQFSGALAYNFLVSIFPILLVLLAIAGFALGAIDPSAQQQLQNSLASAFPGSVGNTIIPAVLTNLRRSAGLVFAIGLVTSIFTGSRLFIAIENFSGIVFRLRGRAPVQQNVMALGMMLLYLVLVPIVFLASIIPTALINALGAEKLGAFGGILLQLAGLVSAIIVASALFGAIYIVVPNRTVKIYEVWKGTLVAGALLVVYELLFPIYESFFLKPGNYGSIAGFALVVLIFFYYLAFILLLGMEINSWASGQRQTEGDLQAVMHELQAHNTTLGAAGPTAGTPSEDLQNHKGASAMRDLPAAVHHEQDDHDFDVKPPEFKKDQGAMDHAANTPHQ